MRRMLPLRHKNVRNRGGSGARGRRLDRKTRLAQRERWNRAVVAVWSATRRDAGLSQAVLAQKLGCSRDTIAAIESGRRKVEVSDVILFATALSIEPETIFRRILRW